MASVMNMGFGNLAAKVFTFILFLLYFDDEFIKKETVENNLNMFRINSLFVVYQQEHTYYS